jgi:hypothetical protein
MAERVPIIYNPSANQLQEVSLSDQVSVGVISARAFSTINLIEGEVVSLASSSFNYGMFGPLTIGTSGTITVGAGVSFVVY